MPLSRRAAGFLLAVAAWNWVIWPTFLRNIARDPRSFRDGSPTGFFLVHLALVAASLLIATLISVLGWRGWQATRRSSSGSPSDRPLVR